MSTVNTVKVDNESTRAHYNSFGIEIPWDSSIIRLATATEWLLVPFRRRATCIELCCNYSIRSGFPHVSRFVNVSWCHHTLLIKTKIKDIQTEGNIQSSECYTLTAQFCQARRVQAVLGIKAIARGFDTTNSTTTISGKIKQSRGRWETVTLFANRSVTRWSLMSEIIFPMVTGNRLYFRFQGPGWLTWRYRERLDCLCAQTKAKQCSNGIHEKQLG